MNISVNRILVIVFLLHHFSSTGQKGVVIYEGNINKIYVDSFLKELNERKEVPMSTKQEVAEVYLNASSDDFTLHYIKDESYYFHVPPLKNEENYNVGSKAGKNPHYFNKKNNNLIENSRSLGYILKKPLVWNITKEKKKIGNYVCYKATASEKLYSRRGFYYNRQVIAWFTPEIPLNFGPSNYVGLPGLVLEVVRDKFTLKAKEIILNPEEKLRIIRPKKNAKIITEKESHSRIAELSEGRG